MSCVQLIALLLLYFLCRLFHSLYFQALESQYSLFLVLVTQHKGLETSYGLTFFFNGIMIIKKIK